MASPTGPEFGEGKYFEVWEVIGPIAVPYKKEPRHSAADVYFLQSGMQIWAREYDHVPGVESGWLQVIISGGQAAEWMYV